MEQLLKYLKEDLERNLNISEKMWKDGEDKSYIVGWLQGAIKGALSEIKDYESLNKK